MTTPFSDNAGHARSGDAAAPVVEPASSLPAPPHDRSALTKEVLASLSIKNDWLAGSLLLLRIGFHVSLSMLALTLLGRGQIVAGLLILVPHCAAMSFLGWAGIGHEFFHQSVFTSRRLNRILFKAGSILTWSNYAYFQATHPVHHADTLSDADLEAMPAPPLSFLQIVLAASVDLPGFWRRLRILGLNSAGIVPMAKAGATTFAANSPARERLCQGARVVLGAQGAMLLAFVLLQQYWLILIVTLAPFCFSLPNRVLAIAQHHGMARGTTRDYVESTRTVLLNPILAFFYANMNFHVEHHFYPGVPYYRLPRLHCMMPEDYRRRHVVRGCVPMLRILRQHGYFSRRPVQV